MKRFKIFISVLLFIILLFQITACRKGDDYNNDDKENPSIGDITGPGGSYDFDIEKYIYLPHEIDMSRLENLRDPVYGAFAHGEYIICWFYDDPDIVIQKLSIDGSVQHETRLPGTDRIYNVKGLSIKDDNSYAMVIASFGDDDDAMIFNYLVYDEHGNEVSNLELFDAPRYFSTLTTLEHVVITDENIVIVTRTEFLHTFYFLTTHGEMTGKRSTAPCAGITQLKDGRVVALFNEVTSCSLREIDFTKGDWGISHRLEINNAEHLIPTTHIPFDFLVNAGGYLIGYELETGKQMPLINWFESGFAVSTQHHIGMLAGNEIFAMLSGHRSTSGNYHVFTNLTVFTQALRSENDQQRYVITIGGIFVRQDFHAEIAKFNLENRDFQIEIREYYLEDIGFNGSLMRMNVELIAGRGPDIIVDSNFGGNTDYLVDLYTFIDADPELDRADFFPGALRAMERPAGKLPFIANNFRVNTMLAKRETAELLYPFTFETILKNLDESNPYSLAGRWITGKNFISNAVLNSDGFIDWDNKKVNFDSDEFIDLLEIAARLPDDYSSSMMVLNEEYTRLRNGRQLLLPFDIRDLEDFRNAKAQIGDVIAVGIPTYFGGQNIIHVMGDIGIYAMSENKDAAWSFIRRLLLPDVKFNNDLVPGSSIMGMPLRLDIFENQIAEAMIKEFWDTDVPFFGAKAGDEKPKRHVVSEGIIGIPIYAMTEEEAQEIRSLINSATAGTRSDNTVWMILDEEFHSFSNGIRTSADTARIIQNRVQTYLNEMG